jgi:hypothetical protein
MPDAVWRSATRKSLSWGFLQNFNQHGDHCIACRGSVTGFSRTPAGEHATKGTQLHASNGYLARRWAGREAGSSL